MSDDLSSVAPPDGSSSWLTLPRGPSLPLADRLAKWNERIWAATECKGLEDRRLVGLSGVGSGAAGGADASQPPGCTTGGKVASEGKTSAGEVGHGYGGARVSCHWLRGSVRRELLGRVVELLVGFFGGLKPETSRGFLGFTDGLAWFGGQVRVFYDADVERAKRLHGGMLSVEFHGEAFDWMTGEMQFGLFRLLAGGLGMKATRVDLAFDDYSRATSPCEVWDDVRKGNFTGYRVVDRPGAEGYRDGQIVRIRDEVDFGRRGENGGGCYLRIYDKGLESEGERDCVRYEVELSREAGEGAFGRLAGAVSVGEFGRAMGEIIGGSVDFVDRGGQGEDRHLERLERLSWWAAVVAQLGEAWFVVVPRAPELAGKVAWIKTQVGGTLALLSRYFEQHGDASGLYRFVDSVKAGRSLSVRDHQLIADAPLPEDLFGIDLAAGEGVPL